MLSYKFWTVCSGLLDHSLSREASSSLREDSRNLHHILQSRTSHKGSNDVYIWWLPRSCKDFDLILVFKKPFLNMFSSVYVGLIILEYGDIMREQYLHYRVHLIM